MTDMMVSATAVPTVRWKWPGIHEVLCTTRFIVALAFTEPEMPPRMKPSIARS